MAWQDMQQLQERMDRDHRPTMVQLRDVTPVCGMTGLAILTVGDIFRAQAYSNKKGRHFPLVYSHDVQTGDVPINLAMAVVARHARARAESAASKFANMPDLLLTPAAVPTTDAPGSTDVWTLSSGKRKRDDP
jgi:hypothetical protein